MCCDAWLYSNLSFWLRSSTDRSVCGCLVPLKTMRVGGTTPILFSLTHEPLPMSPCPAEAKISLSYGETVLVPTKCQPDYIYNYTFRENS